MGHRKQNNIPTSYMLEIDSFVVKKENNYCVAMASDDASNASLRSVTE